MEVRKKTKTKHKKGQHMPLKNFFFFPWHTRISVALCVVCTLFCTEVMYTKIKTKKKMFAFLSF